MTKATRKVAASVWQHTCQICGHKWRSLRQHPARCPVRKCSTSLWDVPLEDQEIVQEETPA